MMTLEQLRSNRQLLNKINWQMTPEKAVEMFLEWGTGWIRGHDFVSSSGDEAYYFVLYDWEQPAQVTLIHRTVEGAEELAKVPVPQELFERAWREDGKGAGATVHKLNSELISYLEKALNGPPSNFSVH